MLCLHYIRQSNELFQICLSWAFLNIANFENLQLNVYLWHLPYTNQVFAHPCDFIDRIKINNLYISKVYILHQTVNLSLNK